jgi:hypothetical protein
LTQEEVFKTEDSINIWWRSSRPFLRGMRCQFVIFPLPQINWLSSV